MQANFEQPTRKHGFTIVELLIVIVIIAILATISIIGYNGIQKRTRDTTRDAAVTTITKALEMYHIDNGGYPNCTGGTYRSGEARGSCNLPRSSFTAMLSPKYISNFPEDPTGGDRSFRYIFGSRKTADTTYSGDSSDNYILGVAYETRGDSNVNGWGPPHNYLAGSSN